MSWVAIIVLAVGIYAMKAVGPVVLGRRVVPWFMVCIEQITSWHGKCVRYCDHAIRADRGVHMRKHVEPVANND